MTTPTPRVTQRLPATQSSTTQCTEHIRSTEPSAIEQPATGDSGSQPINPISPAVHSSPGNLSSSLSDFDIGPSTIPETQTSYNTIPADPKPGADETRDLEPTITISPQELTSPMRRWVTMVWKPTGNNLRFDFRGLNFQKFLDTINTVRRTLDTGDSTAQPGQEHGIHYSINGPKECILTMAEEFNKFTQRIAAERENAIITLRPIDFVVSTPPGN